MQIHIHLMVWKGTFQNLYFFHTHFPTFFIKNLNIVKFFFFDVKVKQNLVATATRLP